MSKFNIGDRVVVTHTELKDAKGTITKIIDDPYWPYYVRVDGDNSQDYPLAAHEIRLLKARPSKPNSQNAILLNHFKTAKSISNVEAQAVYRIRSLSRRVNDLEAQGHVIARERKVDPTGQRYVRYHYVGEKKAA